MQSKAGDLNANPRLERARHAVLLLVWPAFACSTGSAESGASGTHTTDDATAASTVEVVSDSSGRPTPSAEHATSAGGETNLALDSSAASDTFSAGTTQEGGACPSGVTKDVFETAASCYDWEVEHDGIPNTQRTSLRSIQLPEPTVAGESYALTLNLSSAGEGDQVELWGARESCGEAEELVWFGPLSAGSLCAEFIASDAYSSLIMVWRELRGELGASWESVTFCPTGSCGGEAHGVGRTADGKPLDAPIGPFEGSALPLRGPLDASVPIHSGYMRLTGPEEAVIGQQVPITAGYFRLSEAYDQPFSDAWYCVGRDSSFTFLEEAIGDLADHASFEFENITELARCPAQTGPYHLNYTIGRVRQITDVDTDLPEFGSEVANASVSGCDRANFYGYCIQEFAYETQPETKIFGYTVPGETEGNDVLTFRDIAVIQMTDVGPRAACAASGTVTILDDNSMNFELSGVTDWQTCPQGAAATPSAFHGELEF